MFITNSNVMTVYMQTLKNKSVQMAQSKLNKHREMGTKSQLNVFEVAQLMDTLKNANSASNQLESIFFSMNLN